MKVKLENVGVANRILKAKPKLKNSDKYKHLYVDEDLSREQREQHQELSKELKERRENDDYCFIFRNKIVSKGKIYTTDEKKNRKALID